MSGETLQWAGMPNPGVVFHSDDWSTIPFSIVWNGFFIFWEAEAIERWGPKGQGIPSFFVLWGIPFLLVGQYMMWGRFLMDAWLKRRTYYGVTDRRVLLLQEGWTSKTRTRYLEAIPEINREGQGTGTLWLGEKLPLSGGRRTPKRSTSRFDFDDETPVLADIDDVDSVYRLIADLREHARRAIQDPKSTLTYPQK